MKLSGFTVAKNCLSLDYCIEECIQSMLPICDEVVVGEMGSTDGTFQMLEHWAECEPKLRIVRIHDWTQEKGKMNWFVSALNETRSHLRCDMALQLDADEVLGTDSKTLKAIRRCVETKDAIAIDRLNFVKDHKHLIPEGHCCGKYVVRCGPSNLWWPSDEPHQRGEVPLLDMAHIEPDTKIFHLGFLRKREAFYAKARVVLGAFFNEFDQRLAKAEAENYHPFQEFEWWKNLTPYSGYYPELVKDWLRDRGYLPA